MAFSLSALLVGSIEIPLCKLGGWLNYAWLLGWFSWLCLMFGVLAGVASVTFLPHGWRLVGIPSWLMLEDLTAHLFLGGYSVQDWSHLGFVPLIYLPNWVWLVIGAVVLMLVWRSPHRAGGVGGSRAPLSSEALKWGNFGSFDLGRSASPDRLLPVTAGFKSTNCGVLAEAQASPQQGET